MRKRTIALLLMATIALATVAVLGIAAAETDPDCSTATVLNPAGPRGSNFEIDTGTAGANLKVDDNTPARRSVHRLAERWDEYLLQRCGGSE